MPIYKNNTSDKTFDLINVNGESQKVEPGQIIITDRTYVITDLDVIFNSHYYNPVSAVTDITLPLAGGHDLNELTNSFIVTHISDSVTVSLGDVANVALSVWDSSKPVITIPLIDNVNRRYSTIFISGTGTCKITEFRERP